MALTKVQICNVALGRIGVTKTIASLNEDSVESQQCNLHYDNALENALIEVNWSWATVRATLVLLSSVTYGDPPEEWEYQYALPSDLLKAQFIVDELTVRAAEDRIPFAIETVDDVQRLMTDKDEAILVYTRLVTDTTLMSPAFRDHLSWRIAGELAMPLAVSSKLRQEALTMREMSKRTAIMHDFGGQQESPEPDSSLISSRD